MNATAGEVHALGVALVALAVLGAAVLGGALLHVALKPRPRRRHRL